MVCCLPGVVVLFATWRHGVRCLRGLLPGWGKETDSALARLLRCLAVWVAWLSLTLSERVVLDVRSQLGVAFSLGSLRLSHFWLP